MTFFSSSIRALFNLISHTILIKLPSTSPKYFKRKEKKILFLSSLILFSVQFQFPVNHFLASYMHIHLYLDDGNQDRIDYSHSYHYSHYSHILLFLALFKICRPKPIHLKFGPSPETNTSSLYLPHFKRKLCRLKAQNEPKLAWPCPRTMYIITLLGAFF